jgi:hypothetical protein
MDPLAALGLAANILTFIDFGVKLINNVKDIRGSETGLTGEDEAQETAISKLKLFTSKLLLPQDLTLMGQEQVLWSLAAQCHALSERMLALFEKIKPKDPTSKIQAIQTALKSKFYENEKQGLQEALNNCRAQLHLQLEWLNRYMCEYSLD